MDDLFLFHTTIDVRISDINYGGHVGNDRYLSMFHEARIRYLKALSCSEQDIGGSVSLIMVTAHVDYKSQALEGDVLNIAVRIAEISPAKFTMQYRIFNSATNKLVSQGYTVLAGYDYSRKRISRLPASFIEKVNGFESKQ